MAKDIYQILDLQASLSSRLVRDVSCRSSQKEVAMLHRLLNKIPTMPKWLVRASVISLIMMVIFMRMCGVALAADATGAGSTK